MFKNYQKDMAAGIRWAIVLTIFFTIWFVLVKPAPTETIHFLKSDGAFQLPEVFVDNQWLEIPVAFALTLIFWTLASLVISMAPFLDKRKKDKKGNKGLFIAFFVVFFVIGNAVFLFYNQLLFLILCFIFVAMFSICAEDTEDRDWGQALIVGVSGWEGVTLAYCLKNGFGFGLAWCLDASLLFLLLIIFLVSLLIGIWYGLIPSVKPKSIFTWLNAGDFRAFEETSPTDTKTPDDREIELVPDMMEDEPDIDITEETA